MLKGPGRAWTNMCAPSVLPSKITGFSPVTFMTIRPIVVLRTVSNNSPALSWSRMPGNWPMSSTGKVPGLTDTQSASRNSGCLLLTFVLAFDFYAHAASGAGNHFLDRFDIVGVHVFHFGLSDFGNLRICQLLGDFFLVWNTRTLLNTEGFAD